MTPPQRIRDQIVKQVLNSIFDMEDHKYISSAYEAHLNFWSQELQTIDQEFQFQIGNYPGQEYGQVDFQFSPSNSSRVIQLVQGNQGGIHVVLLSCLQITLGKLALSDQVVVACPNTKRSDEHLLYFPVRIDPKKSLKELLIRNQQFFQQARRFADLPMEVADQRWKSKRPTNVFFHFGSDLSDELPEGIDLSILCIGDENALRGTIHFSQSIAQENLIHELYRSWERCIEYLTQSEQKIAEISLVEKQPEPKKNHWLETPYPAITIHERFEEIARQYPEHQAVITANTSWNYRELNEASNQLAHELQNQFSFQVGDRISLLIERSEQMICSILATLKLGLTYVPIDPAYPSERIAHMITDSQSKALITDAQPDVLSEIPDELIFSYDSEKWKDHSIENPGLQISPETGAYIIYTSGSTGAPKGVLITHQNVIRLLINDSFQFDFSATDRWTLFHSFCFDFSVWEMYGPLLYGGACYILTKEQAGNTHLFAKLLQDEKITVLNQTPSAFYQLIQESQEQAQSYPNLRYIIFGGEALNPSKVRSWREEHPNTRLINMYGITETTVHVTYKELLEEDLDKAQSNIGRPIPTLECLILDRHQNQQVAGFPGELYVGGAGLAVGYVNQAELTSQKFVAHPLRSGERIYRSGDLVRQLPNEELEYLGRIDQQVKIRGFRIELGEIEQALSKIQGIEMAAVISQKNDSDHYLTAYYFGPGPLENELIREELKKHLPEYMIPNHLIHLLEVPLTPNGKLDRKSLEALKPKSDQQVYEAAETDAEKLLVQCWEELLGTTSIGRKHHFFRSGGHSLKAVQLISMIRKKAGTELNLGDIFSAPVLSDMAQLLERHQGGFQELKALEKRASYPLSASQKRMFVLAQFEGVGTAYNMPGAVLLKGNIQEGKVREAMEGLMQKHAALRSYFVFEDGEPVQKISDSLKAELEVESLENGTQKELFEHFLREFDLAEAPLFRAKMIPLEDDSCYLFFDMHHIISDGLSMNIIIRDFIDLYQGKMNPDSSIQFHDYAVWQQESEEGKKYQQDQEQYWTQRFTDGFPNLELPTDYPRPKLKDFKGAYFWHTLPKETSLALKELAREESSTLFATMMAIFNLFLSRYNNTSEVIVGTPVNGRSSALLEDCVGFFVNTLAIKSEIDQNQDFRSYLKHFQQELIEDLKHQDYPFESLVDQLKLPRDLSRNPIFDYMFTFINNDEQYEAIEDLKVEALSTETNISKFDLTMNVADQHDHFALVVEYATSLFEETTIRRFCEHFDALCQSIVQESSQKISELNMLTAPDLEIIAQCNTTNHDFDESKTVVHLIDEIASQHAHSKALQFNDQSMDYSEFQSKVQLLAEKLHTKGIQRNQVVAVVSEPSFEMILSVCAILKAGAAFLPIDHQLPEERVNFMLSDSGSQLALSFANARNLNCPEWKLEDFNWNQTPENKKITPPAPEDLAYLIYTSGSTGTPKAVQTNHLGLSNVNNWNVKYFEYRPGIACTKYVGFSFDASIIEIFPCLTSGGELHIIDPKIKLDVRALAEYLTNHQVKNSFLPTKIVEQLYAYELPEMEKLITGGEKLNHFVATSYQLYNTYGPSENSVDATCFLVDRAYANIPIGKPIYNVQAHIVRPGGTSLQAVGVPGELCLSGKSLSSGYLGRQELTSEKFVTCPYDDGKMYHTGDLCRLLPDGNIEFLGRIDQQVKVRGYRIEIGEIESRMLQMQQVQEAVVQSRSIAGEDVLCAYVVSVDFDPDALKSELRNFLPDYMVPAHFVQLDQIPLTPNGKADLKRLAQIPLSPSRGSNTDFVAARNDQDKLIISLWEEVLGLTNIGIHDNFFELGGNSLAIVKLLQRLNEHYPNKVQISKLFDLASVAQLSDFIAKSENETGNQGGETDEDETRIIDF